MKTTTLVAFLGLLGAAAPALAHEGHGGEAKQERFDRMAGKLGLDAAGEARLQKTFEKFRAQMEPLRQDARSAREALRSELENPTRDEGKIASLTSQLQAVRRRMMTLHQARESELKAELTPSQYAQLVLRQGHRFHGRHFQRGDK